MQRLRDNPELFYVTAPEQYQAMAAEPRSTWPSGWDIINRNVKVHGMSYELFSSTHQDLTEHYKQILAELQVREYSHIWIIPKDCREMIHNNLKRVCQTASNKRFCCSTTYLGIRHTNSMPDYQLAKNEYGNLELEYASWYKHGQHYRDVPTGPHTIINQASYLQFEFNYDPYEYGQYIGCKMRYNGVYVIRCEPKQNIPKCMAEVLAATQAAALEHAGRV